MRGEGEKEGAGEGEREGEEVKKKQLLEFCFLLVAVFSK